MQIASLTYGILFFGVPQHVHNSLNNLALAPTEQDTKNESPEMQALKRDFEGLRDMNVVYSQICGLFVTRYFVEVANMHSTASSFLFNSDRNVLTFIQKNSNQHATTDAHNSEVVQLHKTHGQMIKFRSTDDEDFQKVSRVLSIMVQEMRIRFPTRQEQNLMETKSR